MTTRPTLPPLPDPLEIDWPELHSQALGCGVEDRNIHDRYEAAEYGWQDGVDKAIDRVPEQIFDAELMQAYALAAYQAGRDSREPPAILYDGYAVLSALDEQARKRTGPENVSDVLDAVVRALKSDAKEPA